MVSYHDQDEGGKIQYLTKENLSLWQNMKNLNESLDILVSQIKLEKQKKNPLKNPDTYEDKV